jgi:hypothetical protein
MKKPLKTQHGTESHAGLSEELEVSGYYKSTKENAAPVDAAWNPQYALFRKFMQKARDDSGYQHPPSLLLRTAWTQSACLRRKAGMS